MNSSLVNEYINRRMSAMDLQDELQRLILQYNQLRKTYLFIYAVDFDKAALRGVDISLNMTDFQFIHEILRKVDKTKLDFYLETPGGSGSAAEEIVTFLHRKFESVDFLIAGEAKSAGTIMAMSADDIYMTDSGSLGPIDAQIRIGRSTVSAYDYINWIDEKRIQVKGGQPLNAVDATMIAQITPGELEGAVNALNFAIDKLKEWLPKYKFKHWDCTETKKLPVDEKMKTDRANDIATKMANHKLWRDHGKSLKIEDLENLGLKINRVEDDKQLEDIVYRIKIVILLLFAGSNHYKIFQTADESLYRDVAVTPPQPVQAPVIQAKVQCIKCGLQIPFYAKTGKIPPALENQLRKKGIPFPTDNKIICNCGCVIDVSGIRNQLEQQLGARIID